MLNRNNDDDIVTISSSDESNELISSDIENSEDVIRVKRLKVEQDSEIKPSQQWIQTYQPNSAKDVCINPQKLKEVRNILDHMINGATDTKLLILLGPAGCSKSTLVKVLANELIQRKSPARFMFGASTYEKGNSYTEYSEQSIEGTGQSNHFSEFLMDSKYRTGSNLSLILIEELPNIYNLSTLLNFRQSLMEWLCTSETLPPLVVCLTEVELQGENKYQDYFSIENSLTVETLFGKDILNRHQVKVVRFKPLASTFMKKTLNNIINRERKIFAPIPKKSVQEYLEGIISTGDIRSAICNLEIWARQYKYTKSTDEMYREVRLDFFHAIGKIIFSSSNFETKDTNEIDCLSVKEVQDHNDNIPLISLSLLENYPIYNDLSYEIRTAVNITDYLSIGDLLTPVDSHGDIVLRSTRHYLRRANCQGKRRHGTLKFPRHFKAMREYRKIESQIKLFMQRTGNFQLSFNDLNLLYGYYAPQIYMKRFGNSFRAKSWRLGGSFKEIYPETGIPIPDEQEDNSLLDDNDSAFRELFEKLSTNNCISTSEVSDDESSLSDPIESEDSDDDVFNDSIDNSRIGKLVAFSRSQTHEAKGTERGSEISIGGKEALDTEEDVFLSDPELNDIISLGRYKI